MKPLKYLVVTGILVGATIFGVKYHNHKQEVNLIRNQFARENLVMENVMTPSGLEKTFVKKPCDEDLKWLIDRAYSLGIGDVNPSLITNQFNWKCQAHADKIRDEIEKFQIDPSMFTIIPDKWNEETKWLMQKVNEYEKIGYVKPNITNADVNKLLELKSNYWWMQHGTRSAGGIEELNDLRRAVSIGINNKWISDDEMYMKLVYRLKNRVYGINICEKDFFHKKYVPVCEELVAQPWSAYKEMNKIRKKLGKDIIQVELQCPKWTGQLSSILSRVDK